MLSSYPQSSSFIKWRWWSKASAQEPELVGNTWMWIPHWKWSKRHALLIYKQHTNCQPSSSDYGGIKQAGLYLFFFFFGHTCKLFLTLWIQSAPVHMASCFYCCLFNLCVYGYMRLLGFSFNLFLLASLMSFLWAGGYVAACPFIFRP